MTDKITPEERAAIMIEVSWEYLRKALEQLAKAANITLTNERGEAKRNFQLVNELEEFIREQVNH